MNKKTILIFLIKKIETKIIFKVSFETVFHPGTNKSSKSDIAFVKKKIDYQNFGNISKAFFNFILSS